MENMDTVLDAGGKVRTPIEQMREHKDDLSEKHIIDLHKITDMKHNAIDLHSFDKRTTELDGDIRSNINNLGLLGMRRGELVKRIHSLYNHQRTKDAFIRQVAPKALVDMLRELELLDNQLIPEYITLFEKTRIEYDGCKELVNVASALTVSSKFLTSFDSMSKERVEQIEKAMRLTKDMTETMIKSNREVMEKVIDNNKKLYEETIHLMQSKINKLEERMQSQVTPPLLNNNGAKADTVKNIAHPEPAMNTQVDVLKTAFSIEKQALQEKISQLEAMTAATAPTTENRLDAEAAAMQSIVGTPAPAQNPDIVPTGNAFVDAKRQEPDRMEKVKKIIKDSFDETGDFRVMTRSDIKDFYLTKAEKLELDEYKFKIKQQKKINGEPAKKEDTFEL